MFSYPYLAFVKSPSCDFRIFTLGWGLRGVILEPVERFLINVRSNFFLIPFLVKLIVS